MHGRTLVTKIHSFQVLIRHSLGVNWCTLCLDEFERQFTARIDLADVKEISTITIPSQEFVANSQAPSNYSKDYLVQISLIGIGKK